MKKLKNAIKKYFLFFILPVAFFVFPHISLAMTFPSQQVYTTSSTNSGGQYTWEIYNVGSGSATISDIALISDSPTASFLNSIQSCLYTSGLDVSSCDLTYGASGVTTSSIGGGLYLWDYTFSSSTLIDEPYLKVTLNNSVHGGSDNNFGTYPFTSSGVVTAGLGNTLPLNPFPINLDLYIDINRASAGSISLTGLTQSSTYPDFGTWNVNFSGTTATDTYGVRVIYGQVNGSSSFVDDTGLIFTGVTSDNVSFFKSVAMANYSATTTWFATAELYHAAGDVADSVPISFNIISTQAGNTYVFPSSTYPASYTIGLLASTSPAFATSTCGWGDVPCALGNVFDNILNFIFGIDTSEIQSVAGFQLAQQQPFSIIPELQNDFANVQDGSSTMAASSSLSFNLGSGNHSAPFFSPAMAKTLLGAAAPFLRSLALSAMVLLLIYGFYLEIKRIFKPSNQ